MAETELTVKNEKVLVDLAIKKMDGSRTTIALSGARFTLTGGSENVNLTRTTDANGLATFEKLPVGTYELRESAQPTGYQRITTPWKVVVNADGTVTVDDRPLTDTLTLVILNTPVVPGEFRLVKTDSAVANKVLAGAEFMLSAAGYSQTTTTNASGEIVFTNIPTGTYTLSETKAPYGYHRNTATWTVVVTDDGTTTVNGQNMAGETLTVPNDKTLGRFAVVKVDAETGFRLDGAQFTLTGGSENVNITLRTDENGRATFENLPVGTYQLRESAVLAGYQRLATVWTVVVEENGTVTTNRQTISETAPLRIANTPVVPGEFTIHKTDAETGARLAGATFTLAGRTTQTVTTGADGVAAFTDLAAGTYTLSETGAPNGYLNNDTTWAVRVTDTGIVTINGEEMGTVALTVTNTKLPIVDFTISKVDAATGGALEGAVFSLTNGTQRFTATTNEAGIATFTGLIPGSYTLRETSAPNGYSRITTVWSVTIDNDGQIHASGTDGGVMTITNSRTTVPRTVTELVQRPNYTIPQPPPGDPIIMIEDEDIPLAGPAPQTGDFRNNWVFWILLGLSGITILAVGSALLVRRRKKAKAN